MAGKRAVIYKITCAVNGKGYIGVTTQTLKKRFSQHAVSKRMLGNSIRKYGKSNFTMEILLVGDEDYCYDLESILIGSMNTHYTGHGYNDSTGGQHAYAGVVKSDAWRKAHSERLKGRKNGPCSIETKEQISNTMKGRIFSNETKMKQSIARLGKSPANKGIPMTDQQKHKLSIAKKGSIGPNKGKVMSEETKQKISLSKSGCVAHNKGVPMSEQQRMKQIGRIVSQETRDKIRQSLLDRNKKPGT
jgi:group I intron endonuclease